MEKIVSLAVVLVMALFLVNADPMVADAACVAPPSGLVSWWGGDNNALDIVGTNHATLNGATYAPGKVGQAFSFDGNGAFVSVPASNSWAFGTGDFAISFWAYGTTFDDRRPLINNRRTPASDHMWAIEIYPVANRVEFHSGLTIFLEATNLLNGSSWNHIVVTRSGSTLKMFINGVPSGSVSNSTDFSEINDLQIGRDSMSGNQLGGRSFPGLLDEVQIFNHALSESDVAAIFGAGSEGICRPSVAAPAGLVSWWPGNGTADDVVGTNNGTLQGGTAYAPGKVGQGFSFDGTDDFVHVPSPSAIPVGNSSRTITAWVKSAGGTNLYQGILGYGTPASGQVLFFEWGGNAEDLNRLYTMNLASGGRGATLLGYDTWYHVALTHDGSNTKLYVNGQLDANVAMLQNTVMNSAGLRIGKSPDFDGWHAYFKGLIDEPAIFNRALDGNEIAAMYNAGSSGMYFTPDSTPDPFSFIPQAGMPLSTSIVSNPITISGTNISTAISIADGTYSVSADGGATWSDFSTSAPATVNSGTMLKVRQTSSVSHSTSATATLTIGGVSGTFSVTTAASGDPNAVGLVSWWQGENNPYDSVGGNHGTLKNGAGFAAGMDGQAFSFNGSGQYLQQSAPVGVPSGGSPRTLSAWIRSDGPTSGTKYQTIVGYGTPWSNGQTFLLEWGGEVNDRHLYLTGWNSDLAGTTVLEYGRWYHVAATYDGTTLKLYVNGQPDASASRALNTIINQDGLLIGTSPPNDGWHGFFNGRIDDVAVYNRALSAEEIGSLSGVVPDPFSFPPVTGAPLSSPVESGAIVVAGTSHPATIRVSGGEYQINGGAWTSSAGTVEPGATVRVRLNSSAGYSATSVTTLTIGGVSGTFSVTTAPDITLNLTSPTNQISQTINGTVKAGASVVVSLGGAPPQAATVSGVDWSFVISGLARGNNDIAVSASDAGGYVAAKSATIDCVAPRLTVNVSGTPGLSGNGGGTVSSNPAGITCVSGSCAALFDGQAPVILTAAPDGNSLFGSWDGACSGYGNGTGCSLVMAADMTGDASAAALFTYVEPARLELSGQEYPHIRDAYAALAADGTILARQFQFDGGLTLDQGWILLLKGGYNPAYSENSGYSTIAGALTVQSGRLTVERVLVK